MLPPVPTEDRFPTRSTFRPNLDINTPAARRSRRRGGNVLQWAHIRRLWVDNETRSLGIGRVLLQTQLQRLADHGATHWALHLPEDPGNGPAHGLYSQFGQVLDRQFVLRVSF
jgi:GNAT superfamily N-acetyltransferase